MIRRDNRIRRLKSGIIIDVSRYFRIKNKERNIESHIYPVAICEVYREKKSSILLRQNNKSPYRAV